MSNLKKDGKFQNRPTFTKALSIWTLSSFGEEGKFKQVRDTGVLVEYRCTTCDKKAEDSPEQEPRVPHIQISIKRRSEKDDEGSRKKISKNCTVKITEWNRCDCPITPNRDSSEELPPAVGAVFESRGAFTQAIHKYCLAHRRTTYSLKEKGGWLTRTCNKEGCVGIVSVFMTKKFNEETKKRIHVGRTINGYTKYSMPQRMSGTGK